MRYERQYDELDIKITIPVAFRLVKYKFFLPPISVLLLEQTVR